MANYMLSEAQLNLTLFCLDSKLSSVLRKTDNLRKMKGSISDDLYNDFMQVYQDELSLINSTYSVFTEQ